MSVFPPLSLIDYWRSWGQLVSVDLAALWTGQTQQTELFLGSPACGGLHSNGLLTPRLCNGRLRNVGNTHLKEAATCYFWEETGLAPGCSLARSQGPINQWRQSGKHTPSSPQPCLLTLMSPVPCLQSQRGCRHCQHSDPQAFLSCCPSSAICHLHSLAPGPYWILDLMGLVSVLLSKAVSSVLWCLSPLPLPCHQKGVTGSSYYVDERGLFPWLQLWTQSNADAWALRS